MMIKQLDTRCKIMNKVILIKRGHLVGIINKDDYEVGQSEM